MDDSEPEVEDFIISNNYPDLRESYNEFDLGEAAFFGTPIPQGIINDITEDLHKIQDHRKPVPP